MRLYYQKLDYVAYFYHTNVFNMLEGAACLSLFVSSFDLLAFAVLSV